MAQWETLNIPALPNEFQEAVNTLKEGIGAISTALDTIAEPLELILKFINNEANPALLLLQQILVETRKILQDLADMSVYSLIVHPWVPGLGSIGEENPYLLELSSNAFLTAVSASFNDYGDLARPQGSGSMYVLAAGARYPTGFVNALRALGGLFSMQELLSLANRIESIEQIDLENRPPPALPSSPPDWNNAGRLHSLVPPLGNLILQADAMLESLQQKEVQGSFALGEISKFLSRKLAQVDQVQQVLEELQQQLEGDFANVHLLEVHGNLAQEFGAATGFPMNYRYTAGIAIASTSADLEPLKTLLGRV